VTDLLRGALPAHRARAGGCGPRLSADASEPDAIGPADRERSFRAAAQLLLFQAGAGHRERHAGGAPLKPPPAVSLARWDALHPGDERPRHPLAGPQDPRAGDALRGAGRPVEAPVLRDGLRFLRVIVEAALLYRRPGRSGSSGRSSSRRRSS
jgi:hypothetical protein